MAVDMRKEEEYLQGLEAELEKEAERLFARSKDRSDDYHRLASYMWEHQTDFDEYELVFNRLNMDQVVDSGEQTRAQLYRIVKMQDSPYFARIDFQQEGEEAPMQIYIGKFSFWNIRSPYEVFDWRAPIAGMYYEFEYGEAYYDAPVGRVSGRIDCKRQYGIRRGRLEYAFESSVSIGDEILQQELSRTSSDKMKDIVTTIQKEQNRLIRNETADTLIIQGVAGSGKTSIALHRVAYFLYRYKKEISAENFLIISPNRIFVDYISEVLPELGEENVRSVGMEEVARQYLPREWKQGRLRLERMCYQTEKFQEMDDPAWLERSRFKSTSEFVELLEQFLQECDRTHFSAADFVYEGGSFPAAEVQRYYERLGALPVYERLREIAKRMSEDLRAQAVRGVHRQDILEWLMGAYRHNDALELYEEFYAKLGRSELFVRDPEQELEAADIFPLLYVRLYLAGRPENENIKYLVIDEMQDYTPIQYAVIDKLYPCRKTILGDFSQKVVPFSGESGEYLKKLYQNAQVEKLYKSYRSSYEIIEFARKIAGEVCIEPVQRHGEAPEIVFCKDKDEETAWLLKAIRGLGSDADGRKIGIICKKEAQARELYRRLAADAGEMPLHLLTYDSEEFYEGVMVSAVSMCKGLEFDEVLIPDADCENYSSEYDRGLLYVACTRAMHKLTLLYTGEKSRFLG